MGEKKVVVVFGVTGQQGSWTARAFHDAGWHVVGVSRSSKLAAHCDEMRSADLENVGEVARAAAGADVVFAITQPWKKNGSVDAELEKRQCEALVRGVHKAKVGHLIYSSVMNRGRWVPDKDSLVMPHLANKFVVNRLAEELQLPTTIVGPSFFTENWQSPFAGVTDGQVNGLMPEDAKVPHVACRDIGRIVLVAAEMGPPQDGKRYLPAWTDFVSGSEICKQFESWHKKPFSYSCPPDFLLGIFSPESLMTKHFFTKNGRPPFSTDPALQEQMFETRNLLKGDYWTVATWFKEHGYDKKLKPSPTPAWQKALIGAVVVGAAVAAYFWLR